MEPGCVRIEAGRCGQSGEAFFMDFGIEEDLQIGEGQSVGLASGFAQVGDFDADENISCSVLTRGGFEKGS